MRIAVTGTPGTGKTTTACLLAERFEAVYFDVTEEVKNGASSGYDESRGVPVADTEELLRSLPEGDENQDVVVDGHVSHLLEPDAVVVLRCAPEVLRGRLNDRGWDEKKIMENVESEALDIVLAEATEADAPVFEFDTTGPTPEETTRHVLSSLEEGDERVGTVDWSGYIGTGTEGVRD